MDGLQVGPKLQRVPADMGRRRRNHSITRWDASGPYNTYVTSGTRTTLLATESGVSTRTMERLQLQASAISAYRKHP